MKFIKRMGSFNPLIRFDTQNDKKDEVTYNEAQIREFQTNVISAIDDVLYEFDSLTEEINKYVL